jgi:hypothetical protein
VRQAGFKDAGGAGSSMFYNKKCAEEQSLSSGDLYHSTPPYKRGCEKFSPLDKGYEDMHIFSYVN